MFDFYKLFRKTFKLYKAICVSASSIAKKKKDFSGEFLFYSMFTPLVHETFLSYYYLMQIKNIFYIKHNLNVNEIPFCQSSQFCSLRQFSFGQVLNRLQNKSQNLTHFLLLKHAVKKAVICHVTAIYLLSINLSKFTPE